MIPNWIFQKKGLHIFHVNISSLPPKIDEIRFINKQSNVLLIGISESKLDPSILNSEVYIMGYDVIRMRDSVARYVKKFYNL